VCPFLPLTSILVISNGSLIASGSHVPIKHLNISPQLLWQIELRNHCIRLGQR